MSGPLLPPFTEQTACKKVRAAEDGWNSRDPHKVALAYSCNSQWRNRSESLSGRGEIQTFLSQKWEREIEYRLIKNLWARRITSINDLPITEAQRLLHWPLGPRPDDHPGLADLGL
ncbi:MAG: DUF1348 family protein [Alphaproteobacteria bacterium]